MINPLKTGGNGPTRPPKKQSEMPKKDNQKKK